MMDANQANEQRAVNVTILQRHTRDRKYARKKDRKIRNYKKNSDKNKTIQCEPSYWKDCRLLSRIQRYIELNNLACKYL